MAGPIRERNYIIGIYLSELESQPRFRHVYDDIKLAREHIGRWLRDGYVHVLDNGIQDHYAPRQIYKVRIMGVTKVVTRPNSDEAIEMGGNDELAYWLDESGTQIDCRTAPM